MTQHTPEPWHTVDHSWEYTGIYPSVGSRIAVCEINQSCTEDNQDEYESINDANAARIVACVNACAGVGNETLEKIASGEMDGSEIFELAKVKQQRDELQKELLSLVRDIQCSSARQFITAERLKKAETIAKAQEAQS